MMDAMRETARKSRKEERGEFLMPLRRGSRLLEWVELFIFVSLVSYPREPAPFFAPRLLFF